MIRNIWFAICFFLLSLSLRAQVEPYKKAGEAVQIGVRDAAMIDRLMLTIPGAAGDTRQALEQQSVKAHMMPVRRVGFRGTDWSYALASCLEFYVNLNRNFKDNLSPDYIALGLRSQNQRPSMEEGLRFLSTNGTVSAAIMPYDADAIPNAVYATNKYRIQNFLYLFGDFMKGRQKTFEVRKALVRGNPVLVELLAGPELPNLRNANEWAPTSNGTQVFTFVVVGYDETRQAFELLSSWGSEWGNNGYIWVKYADFERFARSGFVMVPNNV